jgi:hypothetical protein
MLCPYLLSILKNRKKCCRFLLLIIFIQHDLEEKIVPSKHRGSTKDLINDRLKSHAQFFDELSFLCNAKDTLTVEQKQDFDKIAQVLNEFRQQPVPLYSENQFNGRGIVLTVGAREISRCKVNLKMVEYIETRLPVQVKLKKLKID